MCPQNLTRTLLTLCLLLSGLGSLTAQNESGRRNLNKERLKQYGYWYDSSTAQFQTAYPIIRSLPPLNSSMPWDILGAYVYLDSLARFDNSRFTETTLNRWRETGRINDTLKYMAKYLYKLVDFNPIIYSQYVDEVSLKQGTRYHASPRSIASEVSTTVYDGLDKTERRAGMVALLESSYALRVKVRSIDSMLSGSSDPRAKYWYRVTADVVDTLKGRVFVSTCPQVVPRIKSDASGASTRGLASYSPPCIQFVYLSHLYFNPRSFSAESPQMFSGRDPEFAFGQDSTFRMRPGQEAVVFLQLNGWSMDSTHDYYDVRMEARTSFGALPIINGQVRDINHIWSNDLMLSYEDWRRNFMSLRDRLLAGTY